MAVKHRLDIQNYKNTLVLEFSISRKKVFFVLVYRKFGQSDDEFKIFCENLNDVFLKINAEKPYCILTCGDFNAHSREWWGDKTDDYGRAIQKLFDDHLLKQIVNKPTYITQKARTCIDLVATDQPNLILTNEIHPSLHTNCHHQINYVKMNLKFPLPPIHTRRVWHYGRAKCDSIRASNRNYNWSQILNDLDSDVDGQLDHMVQVVLNVSHNFVPSDVKMVNPKDPPWITNHSKSFYRKYRKKFKVFLRNGCRANEKIRIDEMKQEYTSIVENDKERYFSSLGSSLSNPSTGPKKYWSALKKIMRTNITTVIPPILKNNIFITDIKEKCVIFNEYFREQCKTIVNSSILPALVNKVTNLSLSQVNISEAQILDHIRSLNVNKAHGHDNIPIRILKICDSSITLPLLIIYKNCIKKGYFPKNWKKANVIPVYKKNERNSISNYRPISLLPIFGKIFEKIIYDNLYVYIFTNNFISDMQSGYKRNDSTVKQLLSITHELFKSLDANKEVRAVFLDISRAFDRVWHDGLIFKLRQIGIEGDMINILKSFLSDREQRVVLDGQFSDWVSIESGVPQGSILGPLLFLVYINDLIEEVDSNIKVFADDTFIYRQADQNSTEVLSNDLEKITNWAHKWKMVFNPDMSKQAVEVIFSNKSIPGEYPELIFNGIPVKRDSYTTHLGLILDSKLNFEKHIEAKITKANSGLGLMKCIKKWVTRATLEQIYKLYVRPHMDYADILYNVSERDKTNIFPNEVTNDMARKIESVQYEAARITTGAWNKTSRSKLYDDLGWETLSDRRTCRKLTLLYEIQKEKLPRYLHSTLDAQQYNENSRFHNKGLLKIFICRTNKYKLSFFPSTTEDWNKLDDVTKKAVSVKSFKKKMFNKIRPKKKSYYGLADDQAKFITLLRMGLSPLRAHKFRYNFLDTTDAMCMVCGVEENTAHYLIRCKSFRLTRHTLFQQINNILSIDLLSLPYKEITQILLYGLDEAVDEKNKRVLQVVANFIIKSKRLDTW